MTKKAVQLSSFEVFDAQAQQAQKDLANGRYRAAFDRFLDALIARTAELAKAGEAPQAADLQVMGWLGGLAVMFGKYDAAEDLFCAYEQFAGEAGNRYASYYAAMTRARLALARGRLDDAGAALSSLGASMAKLDRPELSNAELREWEGSHDWGDGGSPEACAALLAQVYLINGQLRAANGQYGAANLRFERGIQISEEPQSDVMRNVAVQLRLAYAGSLLEMGEVRNAKVVLAELENDIDPILDPGLRIRWLETVGKCEHLAGQLGATLARLNAVIDLCEKGQFDSAGASAVLNRASVKILINRTSEAVADLLSVEEHAKAHRDSALAARARLQMLLANARSTATDAGLSIAPSVSSMWGMTPKLIGSPSPPLDLEDLPRSSNFLVFFEDRALACQASLANGDFLDADRRYKELDVDFAKTDSKLVKTRLAVLRGMLEYYQGGYEKAVDTLSKASEQLREMELKPELWQATRFLEWCAVKLGHNDAQRQTWALEAAALLEELTESLSQQDQAFFLLNKWTAEEETIAARLGELVQRKQRSDAASPFGRLFEQVPLTRELDRFLQDLALHKARFARAQLSGSNEPETPSLSIGSFLKRLTSHSASRATVSFLVLPDRTVIFRRTFMSLTFGVCKVSRIQLREWIRNWHRDVQQSMREDLQPGAGSGDVNVSMRSLDALVDHLQFCELLRNLPTRVRALDIEPDDSLHGLPFGALYCDGQHVLDRYTVSITPATGVSAAPRQALKRSTEVMLAAVSRGDTGFVPLPGSGRELDRIAASFQSLGLRVGQVERDATKAQLVTALSRSSVVHIACHGVFRADFPGQSGLMVAKPDAGLEVLSLREIIDLDLSGVRHATLSSCWSADNFIWPGRWIVSLPHAMCLAGVGSVLGCLWPVNDEAAVEFMAAFYANLASCSVEEALRKTQSAWQRGETPCAADHTEWREPIYWAGFNLYGNGSSTLH